jgi:O-antigen ligase
MRELSTKEKTLYWLVTAFFCTLFLPDMPVFNNIFTAGIFVFCFFYTSGLNGVARFSSIMAEKWRLLASRREVLLMILFYLLHIISAMASHDKQEAVRMLLLRAPLLVFPLSLGVVYIRPVLKNRILLSYCLVVTATALVCLIAALIKYIPTRDSVWLYNDSLTLAIKMQSSYFALVVTIAVFGYIYLLEGGYLHPGYKLFARISVAFLLMIHFMLASRISMTILYTGLLILAGVYVVRTRRIRLGMFAVAGLLLCVLLCVKFFPKTLNRFRELEYPEYNFTSEATEAHYNGHLTPDQWNGANIRLAIWKCGWQIAQRHWLTGVQLGDKQHRLMEAYRENGFDFAFRNRRNMHNNYLDIFCCFGIVGLLLFLAGYIAVPLVKVVRAADWLGLAILLTFAVSMIVESYFDRSAGCLLAGFWFCFVASLSAGGTYWSINKNNVYIRCLNPAT